MWETISIIPSAPMILMIEGVQRQTFTCMFDFFPLIFLLIRLIFFLIMIRFHTNPCESCGKTVNKWSKDEPVRIGSGLQNQAHFCSILGWGTVKKKKKKKTVDTEHTNMQRHKLK